MTEKWKPYLCNVNGKRASIFLDLELIKSAPIVSKPLLLWAWVYMRAPRPDGLSDSEEAPTLYRIEDALNASLAQEFSAIPCGRITTEGRREFYFYGEKKDGLEAAVKRALSEFEGYQCDVGDKFDPSWSQYLDVLFPSPEDFQRIGNMDVLDLLKRQGDVHSVSREVRHFVYFDSEPSRAAFLDAVLEEGFVVESEHVSPSEPRFAIILARTQSVQQSAIDETVIQLLHLARSFGGEYDGWATHAVAQ